MYSRAMLLADPLLDRNNVDMIFQVYSRSLLQNVIVFPEESSTDEDEWEMKYDSIYQRNRSRRYPRPPGESSSRQTPSCEVNTSIVSIFPNYF